MAENATKEVSKSTSRRMGVFQFLREVRQETSKVTWPTFRETWLTTVMVFIMVVLMMIFFFIVDSALGYGVQKLLGIA